ncbi:MAG: hypothetical protein ACYC0H_20685, partial [Solirubrobacteraceae bacterium]
TPQQSALASCSDSEKASILAQLLDDDPTLRTRAEGIARQTLASVDIGAVRDLVVEAILALDTEDLANLAGPRRHGYVEPTDASWQLLEEMIQPWIEDIGRRAHLGLHDAAADLATAVVQALEAATERADGINDCLLREWAPDFPFEAACWVERELGAVTGTPTLDR